MENPETETIVENLGNQARITVCNTLSISTGVAYEQFKPFYSIQELVPLDNTNEAIEKRRKQIDEFLKADYNTYHDCRSSVVPEHHRVTLIDGISYPSVTTVISPDKPAIPFIEEHGAIGTALDKTIKNFIDTGKLERVEAPVTPNVKEGYEHIFGLLEKCKWLKEIDFVEHSKSILNKEYVYSGELDAIGTYEGALAICDFKKTKQITGETKKKYFMQLSAYAKALEGEVDALVILSPYNEPIVTTEIDKYFGHFLISRGMYKQRFGI